MAKLKHGAPAAQYCVALPALCAALARQRLVQGPFASPARAYAIHQTPHMRAPETPKVVLEAPDEDEFDLDFSAPAAAAPAKGKPAPKPGSAAAKAAGPPRLALAHLKPLPVATQSTFTALGSNQAMISRNFTSIETPLSIKARHVILGYSGVKLTDLLLQAYCRAHGLTTESSQLLDTVKKHVESTHKRYIVFSMAWDGAYDHRPNGQISFSGTVCVRHGASGQCASLSLDNVMYGKNRLAVTLTQAQRKDVATLNTWMRGIWSKTGANAVPVILPMATDGLPIELAKGLDAILIQDAIGLCKSVFFDHITRVKDMAMPQTLEEFSAALGSMAQHESAAPGARTPPTACGGPRKPESEARAARQAALVWTTVTRSLKHLGNKLAAEEQMLSGLQGILDVCLVSYRQCEIAGGHTGYSLRLFSCGQRKMLKAESASPAELMRAINEFYKAHARTNVAIVPLEDTKMPDIEHLMRFNANRSLSFRALPLVQFYGLTVPETDPAAAWRRIVTLFHSEAQALSYTLHRFHAKTKLTTLGFLSQGLLERKPGKKGETVLKQALRDSSATSYGGGKAFSMAERNWFAHEGDAMFKEYKRLLFNPERHAREKALLENYKRYLVLDLETTTIRHNKRVASPFCPDNFVVLPGYCDFTGKLTIPAAKLTGRAQMKLPDLSGYDVLVGHNLKFDLLWLWDDPQLVTFFERGGIIWDTMYAEYLISGQTRRVGTGIGLNQIAMRYGGSRKLDEVKSLWDKGVDTKDIDYQILRKYLEGDLRNTEIVFKKQLEVALKDNQIEIIRSRMDVVPCTTEMEFNGLKMNRAEGKRQYDVLREEIQECKRTLRALIPAGAGRMLRPHWNWNSTHHLSAMYWGGTAKIAERNMLGTPKNISAAVEISVRAGAFATKMRNQYGLAFLKNAGLRTTGKCAEVMERIQTFVKTKCPDNFRLALCGEFDTKAPWLFDPITLKKVNLLDKAHAKRDDKYPLHAAVAATLEGFDAKTERVLCLCADAPAAAIDDFCDANGLCSDDEIVFFADIRGLLAGLPGNAAPVDILRKLREVCCVHSKDKTLAKEDVKAVLDRVGSSLGQTDDCFTVPVPADAETHVSLPGLVTKYFPDAAEREKFMKNSKTEKGKMAVGLFAIEEFAKKGEPIAKTLLEMRTKTKLLGTYYETDGTGMMSLICDADECIHHELQLCQTSTSRMASSNPNMQNVPKTDDLRKLFISRFGADGILLETDYSQLEVVVLCALSRDPQMIADILNKVDFHCKRVTLMRPKLTYDEVFRKAKKEKVPEFVELRQKAKIFSFQRQYGAGVAKLSESTGMTTDEIRALIKNEELTYKEVKRFYRLVEHSVNSWTAGLQDASRSTAGNYAYKGEFRALTGTKFTFGQTERSPEMLQRLAADGRVADPMAFLSTQLKNYPIQGFAGEIVQVMLGRLWRHFVANGNYGGKAVLTNTVHDCVWVDCHKDVVHAVGADVKRILNSVQEVFNEKWPELSIGVPFTTETCVGRTMAGMKDIEKFEASEGERNKAH